MTATSPAPERSALKSSIPGADAMPWALIIAACLGGFAATSSGTTRAPFLEQMAQDLGTGLPWIANLFAMTAIAWGVTSVVAGVGSDLWGRRPFLIGGPLALAVAMVGVALSDNYLSVAIWSTLGGACSGIFVGTLFAEVASRTSPTHRGRALGWVMSGQSLTLVVGVPLATWIGASLGWRGVNICVAALSFVACVALLLTSGASRNGGPAAPTPAVSLRGAFSPQVRSLLGMVVAERICFGLAAVYFASFLLRSYFVLTPYEVAMAAIVLPLAVFAIGNVVGTALGGPLADSSRSLLATFATMMTASAAVALVLFGWTPGLMISVGLGFVYMFFNALGRTALMAALANVPNEVRGTVMGLNGTCASIGWVGAAWLGSAVLEAVGFSGFGPLVAALAIGAAALAVRHRVASEQQAD